MCIPYGCAECVLEMMSSNYACSELTHEWMSSECARMLSFRVCTRGLFMLLHVLCVARGNP